MKEPRARAAPMALDPPAPPPVDQPDASPVAPPVEEESDPEPGSAPLPPAFDRDGDGAPGGSPALEPYAVLLADHAPFPAGVVVFGPAPSIATLIAAGGARPATPTDIALAGVHVRALPET